MGELIIPQKFDVHKNSNTVNIVNPYRFGAGTPVEGVDTYQGVLDFASNNSISLPSTQQQDSDRQLITDLKAQGRWDQTDVFFNLRGTADPLFKLIDWKRLVLASAFGGLTWNTTGVLGNKTDSYININFIPSEGVFYARDNASIIINFSAPVSGKEGGVFGSYDGTALLGYITTGGLKYARLNEVNGSSARNHEQGLLSMSRDISTSFLLKNGTVSETMVKTTTGVSTSPTYVLANNPTSFVSNYELSCVMIGSALGANEHDELKLILE